MRHQDCERDGEGGTWVDVGARREKEEGRTFQIGDFSNWIQPHCCRAVALRKRRECPALLKTLSCTRTCNRSGELPIFMHSLYLFVETIGHYS
jgi:hypothetical protein